MRRADSRPPSAGHSKPWVDPRSHRYDAVCQGGDGEAGNVAEAIARNSDIRGSEPRFIGPPESASDNGRLGTALV